LVREPASRLLDIKAAGARFRLEANAEGPACFVAKLGIRRGAYATFGRSFARGGEGDRAAQRAEVTAAPGPATGASRAAAGASRAAAGAGCARAAAGTGATRATGGAGAAGGTGTTGRRAALSGLCRGFVGAGTTHGAEPKSSSQGLQTDSRKSRHSDHGIGLLVNNSVTTFKRGERGQALMRQRA
jgi:hypothetical protein